MSELKNLSVLGANGFLGSAITKHLKSEGKFNIFPLHGKKELDLTKDNLLSQYLKKNKIKTNFPSKSQRDIGLLNPI